MLARGLTDTRDRDAWARENDYWDDWEDEVSSRKARSAGMEFLNGRLRPFKRGFQEAGMAQHGVWLCSAGFPRA